MTWILRVLRSNLFFLFLWVLTGVIGATERFYSPHLDAYIQDLYPELENPILVVLGNSPLFVGVASSIVALFFAFFHWLFLRLFQKQWPKISRYVLFLLVVGFF
jgi:hypothetical protein